MNENGRSILSDPLTNKGCAFTREERLDLGIDGLLPAALETQDQQEAQVWERFLAQPTDLARRMYLMDVCHANTRLFYRSMERHLSEYMPVVYAPTVAQSIEGYCDHYSGSSVAYVDVEHPEGIRRALTQFAGEGADIRLVVATDGEGILGIGDWGVNGAEILTGKLAVYTAAAHIDPAQILPVMIDCGTNRQELLDDPRYLGLREHRVRGERYDAFIDAFVTASLELYPKALLHWEDFGRPCAAPILERYRDRVLTLNDDIQGTGVTVLGALEASRRVARASYDDMRVVIFGAGTAGIGIADQIVDGMVSFGGLSKEDASSRIYAFDRQGLVTSDLDGLTEGQGRYAHDRSELPAGLDLTNLADVILAVRPFGLVGTSTVHGAFDEQVCKAMAQGCERPFIAPISNPTKLAEAAAADVLAWTEGRALVVTGTPSDPVEAAGITHRIGQGNNALMYPGICLGAMVVCAKVVSRSMLLAGARALADLVDVETPGAPVLPPMAELPRITRRVAEAVATAAMGEGLARVPADDVDAALDAAAWSPIY